jgi:DNA-binding response OmpR family regulator
LSVERRAASVLVIDDEFHMRELLEIGLTQRGFAVSAVADGFAGMKLLEHTAVDAIVLDLTLPKLDGIALIPLLRRTTEAPIVMLTAKSDLRSRVRSLEAGADDYLPKPFDFSELAARLTSALRRPALKEHTMLDYADLRLDPSTRAVERGGVPIDLSAREFDLLEALVRHAGQTFSRAHLLELVWGAQREVTTSAVETYICYLRAKIDRPPLRRLIQTVRGVGYCLR